MYLQAPHRLLVLTLLFTAAGCRTAPEQQLATAASENPRADAAITPGAQAAADDASRNVPYEGALEPNDPPQRPTPPAQQPIDPAVTAALDVLYERPSPKGPPPVALSTPKAVYVVGKAPVVQALPGPAAFPEKIPKHLQTAYGEKVAFSNNIEQLPRGEIHLAAVDRTKNDTKKSDDWMALKVSFTDAAGARWRIEQASLATLSSNPVAEPWFGGLVIDAPYHGDTGNGTPAVPRVNCAMCSWGWADIYKDNKRVASSAPLHIMVSSDTRDDDNGFRYYDYDSSSRPIREVHIVVAPSAYLPSPGGFLHVMWENAEVTRGTPEQIRAKAADFEEDIPTIELTAAPHLRWDKKELHVKAGQKYRLLVHNMDPSSFHQLSVHAKPKSKEEGHANKLRHDHAGTAGMTGDLWKPGGKKHEHENPPGPENVFLPLPQGSTWATMIMFEKPGEYEFMCPVGNHYRRGMEGKFIVTADTQADAP